MALVDILRRATKLAADNSPTIMTAVGVVGTVATAVLSAKAAVKAVDLIRLKEGSEGVVDDPKERTKERIELVWKEFIPPVLMCTATIACIIGSNRIGMRRAAGMAAAYTVLEKGIENYQDKVIEKIGEKKEQTIRDEVAQDQIDKTSVQDIDLLGVSPGMLCFDTFSARYFYSTVEDIRSAVNDINHQINSDNNATLGDLYRILNIPPTEYSDLIGWNTDRLIDLNVSSAIHGDKPIIVMDFRNPPGPDYGRFRNF